MRCYAEIRRTPYDDLTVAEQGVLELEYAMLKIREQANEIRLKRWIGPDDMTYDVGFFNGVQYTVKMLSLYSDTQGYIEISEVVDRYASEIGFLSGEYLNRKAA